MQGRADFLSELIHKVVPIKKPADPADPADPDSRFLLHLTVGEWRAIVREEIAKGDVPELFTAEGLAEKMKLPVSWVYEQSRQGNIPTHRIGRYLRFNLAEVLESEKKRNKSENPS
jgi:hypothetical protein